MKELLIRLESDGKIINRFRLKSEYKGHVFTVGSSRRADIRIPNKELSPLHTAFEQRNGKWTVIDLGSETGTWIAGEPVVEVELGETSSLRVGTHSLVIDQVSIPRANVFKTSKEIHSKEEKTEVKQQVVIFFKNELVESYLQEPNATVKVAYGRKWINIKPATDYQWVESRMEDFVVKNRIVDTKKFETDERRIWKLFPEDLVKPSIYALGSTVVFFLCLWIIPKALKTDPGALKENQYTKLIYDKKTVEKQKKKIKKIVKDLKEKTKPKKEVVKKKKPKKSVAKAAPQIKTQEKKLAKLQPSRSNTKVNAKVSKVVSSIKNSGLSSLVSKVSARASNNALIVKAKGPKAGTAEAGRAFASVSDVKGGAKLGASETTGSFRVSGVSTKGVAGGSTVSSRLGGLSGSGIGSASVGAIDEETEIEGGLTAEEIARVVQQNIGAIRYCYERQLAANPNLYGKIKVEFVISPKGKVMSQKVKNSTMKSALVEGCVLRKIQAWSFPSPRGGTEVAVSYPFYFKANK